MMTILVRFFSSFLIMACVTTPHLYAQDNMGIGTATPNQNAILDLSANDKGLLVPRMDTTQRNNIPTGNTENGLLIYGDKMNKFFYWNATQAEWVAIPSSSTDNQNIQGSGISSSNILTIGIENGNNQTVDLSQLDQPNTDNQNLFQNIQNSSGVTQFSAGSATDNLQFQGTGGATVSFNASNNRITIDASGAGSEQNLGYNNLNAPTSNFVNHEVTISGSGANTNIRDYYDPNTDEQDITNTTNFSSSTNELTVAIENGQNQTVDLSSLDNTGTDNQDIQGSGYSASTNELTIDIQNGSSETVDLSVLDQPNTDNQNLLSSTGFSSSTNQLNIDIENGQDQTVDLSSLDNAGGFWDRDAGNGYLYPSNLNDNVGIGTSSPNNAILQVDGVQGERMSAVNGNFNNESGIVRTMIVKNNGHTIGGAKYRGLQVSSQGDGSGSGRTQAIVGRAEGRDLNLAVHGQLDNDVNDPSTTSGNTTGSAILGEDKNTSDPTFEGLRSNRYAGFFSGDLKVTDGQAIKTGNTNWTSASDKRLKKNVHPYEQGLDKIMEIEPVNFQYNEKSGYNTDNEYVGVIAQDLLEIAPYMVSTYQKGDKEYYNVNNSAMTYMLINAVQQQHEVNKSLKEKLHSQQKQIDQLQEAVNALQKQEKGRFHSQR